MCQLVSGSEPCDTSCARRDERRHRPSAGRELAALRGAANASLASGLLIDISQPSMRAAAVEAFAVRFSTDVPLDTFSLPVTVVPSQYVACVAIG